MTNDKTLKPAEILLVEDNEADVRLVKEALKDVKLTNNLYVVQDGEKAMSFLKNEPPWKDAVTPDIVLLDLNLPKKDGREVLKEMKADDHLAAIPVVVLTTSEAEEDILKSYNLHANCYITKPVDINKFADVIRSIENFWFTIVRIPPNQKKCN